MLGRDSRFGEMMNPFKLLMIWACLVLAACGGGGSDSQPQANPESVALELLVPAYVYPSNNTLWRDITDAASRVKVNAVLNPSNGPGTRTDSVIASAVRAFRSAGGKTFGYVSSSYGARAIASAKTDIDRYLGFYDVDGFFIDEMAATADQLAYYRELYAYIKAKGDYRVIGNPGASTLEEYMAAADVLVTYEHAYSTYASNASASWVGRYAANRFAHIVYDVGSAVSMQSIISGLAGKRVGWVYVTDDAAANPYDRLPAYWQDEIAAIKAR